MTLSSRFTIACALALVPFAVALAAPGNVSGITGSVKDGKAVVRWEKPEGEEPTAYRVFYSRLSILQQNGLYDDFETVPATQTEYTFTSLPYNTQTLYVSVLAVNAQGQESPLFTEEARIDFTGGNTSSAMQASVAQSSVAQSSIQASSAVTTNSGVQQMLKAEAISGTGLVIAFSMDVQIDQTQAADAFSVRDASGAALRITRLLIQGKEVTLHTVRQERSKVYRLHVSDVVKGKGVSGGTVTLDPDQNDILLLGHPTGSIGSSAASVQSAASSKAPIGPALPVSDVRSLTLRGQKVGTAYQVEATWLPSSATGIREYRVSQSANGGKTFDWPQTVPASALSIKIGAIPAGDFGVLVQVVAADGSLSKGVFESIRLNSTGGTQGSVIGNGKNGALPDSGLGTFVPVLLSGGAAGWHLYRKKWMKKSGMMGA
jgi:hypothetical protein